jgi:acyl-CoA thioester hydrolase
VNKVFTQNTEETKKNQRFDVVFETNHSPRFDDFDPYGHMSSTSYLSYFNENRMTGHIKILGINQSYLKNIGINFFLRNADIEFIKPVFYQEDITIRSWIETTNGSIANVRCEMLDKNQIIRSICQMKICCVDQASGKPKNWPEEFLSMFSKNIEK